MKRSWVSTLLCAFGLVLASNGAIVGISQVAAPTEPVGLCDVWINPGRYKDKAIRLRAVLVENNNQSRIDGADPFLYDPACRQAGHATVVRWLNSSRENNSAREALAEIRKKHSDEFQVSRAIVIVVGSFNGFWKKRNGQLEWDSEFRIEDVEEAHPVETTLPWPVWVQKHKPSMTRNYLVLVQTRG